MTTADGDGAGRNPRRSHAAREEDRGAQAACGPAMLRYLFGAGLWAYLLHGFVSTGVLVVLSVIGPAVIMGGVSLAAGAFRHALTSVWYFGAFATGLLLIAGGALTLAPAAPATLLVTTPAGWGILDQRVEHLQAALDADDLPRVRRLASRGLGDAAPPGRDGQPLLHTAGRIERLDALLAGGLDPDARDGEGRTLLFKTWDAGIARALLAAGADANARDNDGATPLMAAGDRPEDLVRVLLEAGADVHAVDDRGQTVASAIAADAPNRHLLEAHAGDRALDAGAVLQPLDLGRTDWLVAPEPAANSGPSAFSIDAPVQRGAATTLEIRLVNDTGADRLLDVRAYLNETALFVHASHDGAIENPRQANPWQVVRWPALAMPAGSEGHLSLQVFARADDDAGDLSIDVRAYDRIGQAEEMLQVYERPSRGEVAGGRDVSSLALLATAAVLSIAVLQLVRRRSRSRQAVAERPQAVARLAARVILLIAAAVAAILFAQSIEPFVRYDQTQCTVLDRRALMRTSDPAMVSSMSERRRFGATLRPGSRPIRYEVPLVAVRIDRDEGPALAAGFTTGMATRSVHELRHFPLGATVPCWVDPDDAATFTLTRQPSAAAIVALGMLTLLALALAAIARRLSPRVRPSSTWRSG